jgi:hypothetical protein
MFKLALKLIQYDDCKAWTSLNLSEGTSTGKLFDMPVLVRCGG